MRRVAFTMRLKKGYEEEYLRRHDAIWPELAEELRRAGIRDYSIFLDTATGLLFAVQKLTADNSADDLPAKPVMKKWWDFMADIMDVNPDNSPACIPLEEVFHLD